MSVTIPLLLFAKAPVPGKVKTRLQTHCSQQQAADIASFLMEQTIKLAVEHWQGPVSLSIWLQRDHPFFDYITANYPINIVEQCAGDLGAKMQHALSRAGYPAAVMGCDAPHMSAKAMRDAHQCLQSGRPVIGPSSDGGYYFLGLPGAADRLFQSIEWGTASVLKSTMAIAAHLELRFHLLPELNDIDHWEDLQGVATQFKPLANFLRAHKVHF